MIFRLNYETYEVPDAMNREQITAELERLPNGMGEEEAHEVADQLLLLALDDARITAAFEQIEKWYA